MHDYELLRLVPGQSGPRVVHVRRRFEERDVLLAEANRGGLGLFLRAPGAAVALRELVCDEESDVVAGGGGGGGAGVGGAPPRGGAGAPPRRAARGVVG